jgi:hypothetical protein
MWFIIDSSERRITESFDTREEAEARFAEVVAEDPTSEQVLRVQSAGEPASVQFPSSTIRAAAGEGPDDPDAGV